MSYYRTYLLDGAGQIFRVIDGQYTKDEDALAAAKDSLEPGEAAEVWESARWVGKVSGGEVAIDDSGLPKMGRSNGTRVTYPLTPLPDAKPS